MTTMVIVYYLSINSQDIKNSKIYYRYYKHIPYEIGHINSYDHEVIAIFCYSTDKNCYLHCKDSREYVDKMYANSTKKVPLKNRIIDKVIDFLEKNKG